MTPLQKERQAVVTEADAVFYLLNNLPLRTAQAKTLKERRAISKLFDSLSAYIDALEIRLRDISERETLTAMSTALLNKPEPQETQELPDLIDLPVLQPTIH